MANFLVTYHTYLVLGLETVKCQTIRILGLSVAELQVFYCSCQQFASSLLPSDIYLDPKYDSSKSSEMSVTPDHTPNSTIPQRTIFLTTTI